MPPCTLTFSVVSARNVLPADSNGLSDPYVKLFVGDAPPWRSPIKATTLNPHWDVDVSFSVGDLDRYPYAIAEVWDADAASSDDPLGSCVLPLGQMLLCGGGTEVEFLIGRDARTQKTSGSLRLRVSATLGSGRDAAATLLGSMDDFGRRCASANANPAGLGSPSLHPELLEAVFPAVTLSFLGSLAVGTLYVSNARLIFVPEAKSAARLDRLRSPSDTDLASAADWTDDGGDDDDARRCGLVDGEGCVVVPLRRLLRVDEAKEADRSGGGSGSGWFSKNKEREKEKKLESGGARAPGDRPLAPAPRATDHRPPRTGRHALAAAAARARAACITAQLHTDWRPPTAPQWTAMLDLVQRPLEAEAVDYCRLDGSMSQPARAATLARFEHEPQVWEQRACAKLLA